VSEYGWRERDSDDIPHCAYCGASLGIRYGPGVRCCWSCAVGPPVVEAADPDPRSDEAQMYPPLTAKEKEAIRNEKRSDERTGEGAGDRSGSDQAA
jgi:hypothetical protein